MLVDNFGNSVISDLDLDAFQHQVLKTPRPMGFAEANNFALIHADELGKYIIFLNQDTRSDGCWVDPCIDFLENHPSTGALTPLTVNHDDSGYEPYFLECARKSPAFAQDQDAGGALGTFYETPVIPAAAMVVRRAVLEEVGPFDPIYGSYYEDYDLCQRIRRAGYNVGICSGGTIQHYSGSATTTVEAERRRARWVTRNRVILKQREGGHGPGGLLAHFLFTFPRGLARSLLRRAGAKPLRPYLAAHWDLLRLAPRLVSKRCDETLWRRYLTEIGWPRTEGMASA